MTDEEQIKELYIEDLESYYDDSCKTSFED